MCDEENEQSGIFQLRIGDLLFCVLALVLVVWPHFLKEMLTLDFSLKSKGPSLSVMVVFMREKIHSLLTCVFHLNGH